MANPTIFSGTIVVDNTLWYSRALIPTDPNDAFSDETNAIKAFNEHILKDPRSSVHMLPIRDGMTVIQKV